MATVSGSFGRFARSPGFKFFVVGALVFLLSIPLVFVWFLVTERQTRSEGVAAQIAEEWGGPQSIRGPYLIVPYQARVTTLAQDGKPTEQVVERRAVFLPETLNVDASATAESRRRSIYDVTVYRSTVVLDGRFATPEIAPLDGELAGVRWQDAIVALSISDVSGLAQGASLDLGGTQIAFEPSIGVPNATITGIHARLPQGQPVGQPPAPFTYRIALDLNGSSAFDVAPVARDTAVSLKSNWPHPSFNGAFLPTTREVSAEGFAARWQVPHLARSVPQSWAETNQNYTQLDRFQPYVFGAQFYVPVDYYDLVNRAAKYGLMFLAVAFMAVFVMELTSGRPFHPVQYVFVGLAMIIFYVLLLSLSEHVGFTLAYLLAATATGAMLAAYVGRAIGSAKRGLVMAGIFAALYAILYLILRLEDYALLAGSIVAFIMLTIAMFATLRIDWSTQGGGVAAKG